MYRIYTDYMSDKAKRRQRPETPYEAVPVNRLHLSTRYPFKALRYTDSFTVPIDEGKNLRAMASAAGKAIGVGFGVIKHADHNLYEVFRIT